MIMRLVCRAAVGAIAKKTTAGQTLGGIPDIR
jgi:hypothetical protein